MISIGVIIVTRNRPLWMERCIRSLFSTNLPSGVSSLKVSVCLNGDDAESHRRLLALQAEFGSERLLLDCLEKPLSPSSARNRLVGMAREDWLYFVDDDAYVPAQHFGRFAETLAQHLDAAVIGGPNILPEDSGPVQRATDVVLTSFAGTHASAARYSKRGKSPRRCTEESLILCNLFIKRAALGPDPFPDAFICAEENSVLFALALKGASLYYDPELFNRHERRGELSLLLRQVFNYGLGRSQFARRHPDGLRLIHVIPSAAVVFSVYSLIAFFAHGARPDLWFGLASIYGVLCVGTVVLNTRSPIRTPWWSILLFPLIHSSYGMGLLYGLFSRRS